MARYPFPQDFFETRDRPDGWSDDAELRRALDWFKSKMAPGEWERRRLAAAERLYDAATQTLPDDGKGRFFVERDTFGWYMFLVEAFLDHVWNYDPVFGSRVVPVFKAIGRDLPLLGEVAGLETRAERIVGAERSQPNGGLFEMLVAAVYRRHGFKVEFVPEIRGGGRTHDMNVKRGGVRWAVECKRMETSAYGERERTRMRELWCPTANVFAKFGSNVFADVRFKVPVSEVPDLYLRDHALLFKSSGERPIEWSDAVGGGQIRPLDLGPLKLAFAEDIVLASGPEVVALLTGSYVRNAAYVAAFDMYLTGNPRYASDCLTAVLLRWLTDAEASVDAKARDVRTKLAEASDQLPNDVPGIVHIGFEAVDGDEVERRRHAKILETTRSFDPRGKPLEFVYVHYFVPESPPDLPWAFDETVQWCCVRPTLPKPLGRGAFLILPETADMRTGPHWRS